MRTVQAGAPARFARQDYFPQGWQACIGQFVELFHRYGYIYKSLAGGSWYSSNEKWKLPDSEILKAIACVHPRFLIGCRSGKSSRFAVLDIDQSSQYHNQRFLDKLLKVLSEAGLERSSLYRSSYSGGWHLYLFFDEPINSSDLRRQLVRLLALSGFKIEKGQLEVFPSPGSNDSLGHGLRLPLQPGFAWLDKKTLVVEHERHELNATQALELFVDALDGDANSYADFRKLKTHVQELEQSKNVVVAFGNKASADNVILLRRAERSFETGEFIDFVRGFFHRLPPGIIVDNWYKGRIYHLNGLTGPSQRAESIECLGHYFFYGDPSRDLPALGYGYELDRQWAIEEFLSTQHNGQSEEINERQCDAIAQVERATNWVPAHRKGQEAVKYKPARHISWVRENANRKLDARKRIAEALFDLKKLERSFTTVQLQEAARCSRRTLYAHQDLWRQDYEDVASGFFAICTDEYNGVEGPACSKSKTPLEQDNLIMPSGRLAARRIAYEISMRHERSVRCLKKASVITQDLIQKNWMNRVHSLIDFYREDSSLQKTRSLLVVLSGYLITAPNFESEQYLQTVLQEMRVSLAAFRLDEGTDCKPPPVM